MFRSSRKLSTETVLSILYQPQAVFRVRTVTRCTASLPGDHTLAQLFSVMTHSPRSCACAAVCARLCVTLRALRGRASRALQPQRSALGFRLRWVVSPWATHCVRLLSLLTGRAVAGDTTVRVWDVSTETPRLTLSGHTNWVMAVRCVRTVGFGLKGTLQATVGREEEGGRRMRDGGGVAAARSCVLRPTTWQLVTQWTLDRLGLHGLQRAAVEPKCVVRAGLGLGRALSPCSCVWVLCLR